MSGHTGKKLLLNTLWEDTLEKSLTSPCQALPGFAANVPTLTTRLANPNIGGESKFSTVIIFLEMCLWCSSPIIIIISWPIIIIILIIIGTAHQSSPIVTSVSPCCTCPAFSTSRFSRLWNEDFHQQVVGNKIITFLPSAPPRKRWRRRRWRRASWKEEDRQRSWHHPAETSCKSFSRCSSDCTFCLGRN